MSKFFYILCYLVVGFCYSQSNNTYSVKWLNASQGLNQLSVRNCMEDNDGFVWIATEMGLYRYDGNTVSVVKDALFPEISSKRIYVMTKDSQSGIIYFATHPDLKTYAIIHGRIKEVNTKNEDGMFVSVNEFINSNTSIYKRIYKHIKNTPFYNVKQKLYDQSSIIINNFFYFKYYNSIICINEKGKLTKFPFKTNTHLYLMKFGNYVLATDKRKLLLLRGNSIQTNKIEKDSIINEFFKSDTLLTSNSGIAECNKNYFLFYNGKVYKIEYKNNRLYTKFLFDSPSQEIRNIYYSNKNDMYYIGSNTMGLAIIKLKKLSVFLTGNSSMDCNYVVVENKENWFNYNGWKFNKSTKKQEIRSINNYGGNSRFLLSYQNHDYYEAKNSKLISIQDLKTVAPIYLNKKLSNLITYTYLNQKLWISSYTDLGYLENDTIAYEPQIKKIIKDERLINSITAFNDKLIISSTKGVYKYDPITKVIIKINGLDKVNARYCKPIDKYSYWIGCYGEGLYLVKKDIAYKVIDKNIEINTAHAIVEDEQQNLWISTNNGLLCINKHQIISQTLQKKRVECYRFSIEDGLETNEFNGGSTHPSLKAKDGIIGFPSMKGFVWFDPYQLKKHQFKGSIEIDSVLVNNRNGIVLKNNQYYITKDTELLTINFSYAYHFNRENLTIAYRFEDQSNWTEIKGNSFQIGRYKKGNHKLLIRITTHGFEKSNGITQSLAFHFEARYYEMWWFWGICTFLFTLFIFISYKIGLAINKSRKIQLEEKIEAKTQELLLTIFELDQSQKRIQASLIEKDILLKEIHHRVKNNLQLVMSLLNIQAQDQDIVTIDEFIEKGQSRIASMVLIHENLYQNENVGNIDFMEYLHNLIKNIRNSFGDVAGNIAINVAVDNVNFDIQTAIPLGLIINELVTNSFKHGFPNNRRGSISILLHKDENVHDGFLLEIVDDGIGIKTKEDYRKSLGLELVNLLVMQLKGTIKTETIGGTRQIIYFTAMKS